MKEIQTKKTSTIHPVHSASVHGKHTHNYATNHKNHSWRALEDQKSSNQQEKTDLKLKKSTGKDDIQKNLPHPESPNVTLSHSSALAESKATNATAVPTLVLSPAVKEQERRGEDDNSSAHNSQEPITTLGRRFCNSVTCQIPR